MEKQTDAIIRKIRALRARAADAASSEAEAAMAAAKAAELLAKHNLSISEVEIRSEGVDRQYWKTNQTTMPPVFHAGHGIQKLSNTKILHAAGRITVIGSPADTEVALYFLDLVSAACQRCWKTYQSGDDYRRLLERGKSARSIDFAFRKGVAVRLGERLASMAAENVAVTPSSGCAIVPIKNAMVEAFMTAHYGKLGRARLSVGDVSGFTAGMSAAETVSLHRGLGSNNVQRKALT